MSAVWILAALVIGAAVLGWFAHLERSGRGISVVLVILTVVVVESTLFHNQSLIEGVIFHPTIGGQTLRLFEILIPIALLARLLVRGAPTHVGLPALWWGAFIVWLSVSATVGFLQGHDSADVLFQAKAIIYLGGGFALAAGVPARDYVDEHGIVRLIPPAAILATVMILLTQANRTFEFSAPGMSVPELGVLGSDAASVFVALAVIALALGACRADGRLRLMLAAAPLILTAAFAGQRAALLGLTISVFVLIAAALSPTARRRLHTTPTEMGLVALATGALFLAVALVPAAIEERAPRTPLAGNIEETFGGLAKQQSAQARTNQWTEARALVAQRPILGWGLGKTYTYYRPGPNVFEESQLTHNIGGDLLLRTGLAGLALFVIALWLSIRGGIQAWRYSSNNLVAAFSLGLVAVVVGLLGKGMVESLFEQYRLVTLLGLLLGMLRAAATSHEPRHSTPATATADEEIRA
ncbi:MAG: hypothetical protein M5U31_08415 [Acidimicrobiia bacterium]|nr:hypothetical protein [Acidimicrobiia bacterium]